MNTHGFAYLGGAATASLWWATATLEAGIILVACLATIASLWVALFFCDD